MISLEENQSLEVIAGERKRGFAQKRRTVFHREGKESLPHPLELPGLARSLREGEVARGRHWRSSLLESLPRRESRERWENFPKREGRKFP